MKTQTKRSVLQILASAIAALALTCSVAADGAEAVAEGTNNAAAAGADTHRDNAAAKDSAAAAPVSGLRSHHNPLIVFGGGESSTTGGVDPHGNSWQSIQNSLQQFAHSEFVLRLFLSLTLAVGCAWVIAWHPRSLRRGDPVSALEERKAFIILGVVGAVVAELSGTSATLAFVIFGIGALLRFRTVLDNPKATGKAILVVVIGLACGMGSWTMAVFVTAFSWALIYWLDSHLTCSMSIRCDGNGDSKPLQQVVQSLLLAHRCRLQRCTLSRGGKRMEFLFHMPASLDQQTLEVDLKAKLPKNGESRVRIEVI